ncbi:MAG: 3-dehydroquinate synthase [Bacteroidales bacterium]|nr:3-dehydroquinate synthase [Candidatus Physcousia equi]
MKTQNVIISQCLERDLEAAIKKCNYDRLFVLTDTNTVENCWPLVCGFACLQGAKVITIGASDDNKTVESLCHVWDELQSGSATRHSLLVNIGGGMVTDLGGFAASTYQRGIQYINIPTTLLAMVDASVGGKTGINYGGLKNQVGVFNLASSVILHTCFLKTLDHPNIASGYAEMLKHGLLSDDERWAGLLAVDLASQNLDLDQMRLMVASSVAIKQHVVDEDPTEKGMRKVLNLGHTVGHAIESLAMEQGRTILHGYAVAWGLVCELYMSVALCGFPQEKMRQTVQFIHQTYGRFDLDCKDYDRLYELMRHDKKNVGNNINFALLANVGDVRLDQKASRELVYEAFDFLREG